MSEFRDTGETRDSVIAELEGEIWSDWLQKIEGRYDRKDASYVAANIALDRYNAGSSAAEVAIYLCLVHGPQEALDFARDLKHHEG